jgi:hypothetical protein
MRTRTAALGLVLAVGIMLVPALPATAIPDTGHSMRKEFKNCTALNKVYPHGVGKSGAKDKTSGTPVTNFKKSTAVYNQNKKSDRDKDGVACEKK